MAKFRFGRAAEVELQQIVEFYDSEYLGQAGRFLDDIPTADRFVAVVAAGMKTKDEFLAELSRVLNLPGYFGNNWDALSDCLRDFHWLSQRDIVLVHTDFPPLPLADQRTYLDVLKDACLDWRPEEEHRFVVLFPESAAQVIGT